MGNNIDYSRNNNIDYSRNNNFKDYFTGINEENIAYLRNNYKIIDVDYLDTSLVYSKMFGDNYFKLLPQKKDIINDMLDYYINHKDRAIYKKTNYLCNEKEKICICNTHANDFRKIYDGINYKHNEKYISWFKC
jgi:hypothetical protein